MNTTVSIKKTKTGVLAVLSHFYSCLRAAVHLTSGALLTLGAANYQ